MIYHAADYNSKLVKEVRDERGATLFSCLHPPKSNLDKELRDNRGDASRSLSLPCSFK